MKQLYPQRSQVNINKQASTGSAGFSLTELLIANTVGLMLIAGMIAVFQSNQRSSMLNTSMTDIQENARFAMDKLADDIRMSGFQGCIDINSGSAQIISKSKPTSNLHASAAYASVITDGNLWTPAPPDGFNTFDHIALAGTHALILQFGDSSTFPLKEQISLGGVPNRAGPIVVDTKPGISSRKFDLDEGDYAMISNCTAANIFRVTGVAESGNQASIEHAASLNETAALANDFGDAKSILETKVMRFVSNIYYIADTGLTNDDGNSITALFQQSLPYDDITNNPPTELIRGVENMRVSFGIRTGSESLTYVLPTDSRFDARMVESVRIGLLMSSYDSVAQSDDVNTYVLAGQPIMADSTAGNNSHPGDRRFRLAFNTTVKVRNRRNTLE